MALSLAIRSACRAQVRPLMSMSRLSTSAAPKFNANILRRLEALSTPLVKTQPLLSQQIRSFAVTSAKQSSTATGKHATLWTIERFLSAGLLLIIPAAIAFPSQPLDALMAVSIVMHQYWGMEAIVVDYVRPIIFGNVVPKLAHGLLIGLSAAMLGGLFYFIVNDIGIAKAVRKFWAIKAQ